MADDAHAAHVYATALLGAAGDQAGNVDADLQALAAGLLADPSVWSQLTAPEVQPAQQRAALDAVFADGSPVTRGLVRTLVDNGRLLLLPQVVDAFHGLVREQEDRLEVHVTTAVPLPDALRARIEEQLSASSGRPVDLTTDVDPDIVGGLVARTGDTLFDGSLRGRLDQLQLQLTRPSATPR